jgi:hypothetical protein
MVMERAERKTAERITGVSNLTYDLITLLQNKLEAITAYEVYKQDAQEAGNTRAQSLFEHCQDVDRAMVNKLRRLLADELGVLATDEDPEGHATPESRGGSLKTTELPEIVEETLDESFPASDPPSFTGTTV